MRYSLPVLLCLAACPAVPPPEPQPADAGAPVVDAPVVPSPDAPPAEPNPLDFEASSTLVTWTCTSAPCPWGASLSNQAASWPWAVFPSAARLGYEASANVYLAASRTPGLTLTVLSGSAVVYAGDPANPERLPAVAALDTAHPTYAFPEAFDPGAVVSVESSGDAFVLRVSTR